MSYLIHYACGHWRYNLYRKNSKAQYEQSEVSRKKKVCPECESVSRTPALKEQWGHEFEITYACGHNLAFFKLGNGAARDAEHLQAIVTQNEEFCPTCEVVYPAEERAPNPLCVECGEPLNIRTRNGALICGRCAWGADAIYLEGQRRQQPVSAR